MKNKFVLIIMLLTLALLSAACAAQDATNEPIDATTISTPSTNSVATADSTGEADMTPTGAVGDSTPAQGAGETSTAPTTSPDGSASTPSAGGTAIIPQTGGDAGEAGIPDDLDEVMRILVETGATVEVGDAFELDAVSVPGQTIRINGEDVQIFTYPSAEQLEVEAAQVEELNPPLEEPYFYKMGTMLVRYVGTDPLVRDLLEDVLGADVVGQ
jgi:hypothetical protein